MRRYADQLKRYLLDYKPKMTKELNQKPGGRDRWCEKRGAEAEEQKSRLVESGMLDFEAEEVIRSQLFPAP